MKLYAIKYLKSYYEFRKTIDELSIYQDQKITEIVFLEIIEDENGEYYMCENNNLFISNIFPLFKDKKYKRVTLKEI